MRHIPSRLIPVRAGAPLCAPAGLTAHDRSVRPAARACRLAVALIGALLAAACADPPADMTAAEGESWSVTAWGRLYEVFPEVDPLAAGEISEAHTHVTILQGFAPLTEGAVEIVLRGSAGEQVFRASEPARPGIFNVEIRPDQPGEYELAFRIRSAAGVEEVAGGRVRVGSADAPATLISAPTSQDAAASGEPVPFLKEQQWRTDFATSWVQPGTLPRTARGLARVRPPAGGEASITAPVDGVVQARPWPFPGQLVTAGETLFEIMPRVAAETSLPELQAELSVLESELTTARGRLARLEELLAVEAVSQREIEEARTRTVTLEARLSAARRDLGSAQAVREGQGSGDAHTLRAPFAGAVASISGSPGAAVDAGADLARLVRTDRTWLEVQLPPEAAALLAADGAAGIVIPQPEGSSIDLQAEEVRLVSVAPEVDPAKGTVTALLEVIGTAGLVLGTTVEAEVLLPVEREGIVVPTTALVDDGGVTVVYLQLEGESFARQEVRVAARQGERALVEGLSPGQRLVTLGGDAIRRATLISGGEAQGHVH